MRSIVRWSILAACLVLAFATAGIAGTPQAVQLQAHLKDSFGNSVPNGVKSLILTGWDDSTGGTLLWTQNQNVTTQDGLFQCFLESPAAAAILSHSGQQYIQVQVAGQSPLMPRLRLGSVPSALLTTRMDGDLVTRQGEIHITSPGSGDPDFDLLRITANSAGSNLQMAGGDPDFDLLRITTNPAGSSVHMAGGDPDFDLLRITATDSTGKLSISNGDPDFDLLRIWGDPHVSEIKLNTAGGDPDFDLLRVRADATGSSMAMNSITGDPDFDLLRITATDSTGKIAISHGDPDFDLLRITGNPSGSSMTLNGTGDPDFDLLRVSAAGTTGSMIVGSGDPDFDLLRITGSPAASSIVLNPGSGDPDFDLLRIVADDSGGSIAVNEEGVQRVKMSGGNGAAKLSLNGLPPGTPVDGQITMEADSTGGTIAIDEEGVQFVKLHGGGGGGGGSGGGSIAVNEEGTHNFSVAMSADSGSGSLKLGTGLAFRCILESFEGAAKLSLNGLPPGTPVGGLITMDADSTGASIAVNEDGTNNGARLTVNAARKQYDYKDVFPCGTRNVEVGTYGLTMTCTPGGSTTPDTAVQVDPTGHLTMAGDLAVGGDICAVGTIGACSDARYKTDVTQLEGALAQLARLRGVNFNWRTDEFPNKNFRTDRDFGFIAQEVKEVVPQVVTLGKDGYYSVDYGRLTPILVEAVKELDAKTRRIDELESRLAALEAQMLKLAAGVTNGEATLASSR